MGPVIQPMHPGMKCRVFPVILSLRHPFLHSNTHVQKEEYNYNLQMAAQSSVSIKSPLWLVCLRWTSFDPRHQDVHSASPVQLLISTATLWASTFFLTFFLLLHPSLLTVLFLFLISFIHLDLQKRRVFQQP